MEASTRPAQTRDAGAPDLDMRTMLRKMIELGASDLHVAVGLPPIVRIHGALESLAGYPKLRPDQAQALAYSVMKEEQIAAFEAEKECDASFGIEGLSRFRLNVYRDRGSVAAAFRAIPFEIRSFQDLGLPKVVADLAYRPNGLVLICGPTGSGKSTTLASVVDRINRERSVHIITIEDPIEYLHSHKKSVINQREINADTKSFAASLKHVLRQDPDVILIGEMRDPETIATALTVAETGHLAFATLHTNDATQTMTRIIDAFPSEQQNQIRTQLALVLEGVVVQQLLPRSDGKGRVLAMEIMIPTTGIRANIRENHLHQISNLIVTGGEYGMMTMNKSLYRLLRRNLITMEVAFQSSHDPDDLRRMLEKGE